MKIIHVTCGMKNIIWKEIIEFILRQARGGLIFGGKGGGGGGGLQPDLFFCFQVDGPINGRLIIRSLRYTKNS